MSVMEISGEKSGLESGGSDSDEKKDADATVAAPSRADDESKDHPQPIETEATSSPSSSSYHWLFWTPPSCRYDATNPPKFTLGMNLLFSFATTATVGNLYYNQPILYQIADTFHVSFERSSAIATLMQAGYASGMVLLCPVGDLLPRRPFILSLVAITTLFWLGLCLTNSFTAFAGLSFICGFTTVTPQLMLPLVGELAPPHRRATALSIVVSGLSLGMLVARVLSGIIANYSSWRNIYWFSLAAQSAVFLSLFFCMPDYPTKNHWRDIDTNDDDDINRDTSALVGSQRQARLARFAQHVIRLCRTLYGGIVVLMVTQPVLAQACLIVYCLSAVFTSYWTTLSFLLASPPYNYSSLVIGLFGLIGIVIICFGPLYSRFVIDKIVPVVSVLIGVVFEVIGVAIGVAIGPFSVAGPVIEAILIDFGNQCSNIALRSSVYGLAPKAQNRVNAAYMISSFTGQLSGTAAGNRLYAQGGWRYSGGLMLGFLVFSMLVSIARGPREKGWLGWHGGWAIRKRAGRAQARDPTEGTEQETA